MTASRAAPFQALLEKACHADLPLIMMQLLTLAPLTLAELSHTEFSLLRKIIGQALPLAGPSVLLGGILMRPSVKHSHPQYFWNTEVMLGATLGGVKLGAHPSLFTTISLESMIDGWDVALFVLLLRGGVR